MERIKREREEPRGWFYLFSDANVRMGQRNHKNCGGYLSAPMVISLSRIRSNQNLGNQTRKGVNKEGKQHIYHEEQIICQTCFGGIVRLFKSILYYISLFSRDLLAGSSKGLIRISGDHIDPPKRQPFPVDPPFLRNFLFGNRQVFTASDQVLPIRKLYEPRCANSPKGLVRPFFLPSPMVLH